MKIVVDEMPSRPKDCRYSRFSSNEKGDTWFGCTRGTIVCPIPNKTCPYFTDLNRHEETGNKLKPCPFCGGGKLTITHENAGTENECYLVECEDCGALTSFVNSTDNGEKAWNCSKAATINSWNRRSGK